MIEFRYYFFLLLVSNIFQINCIKYEAILEDQYNYSYPYNSSTTDILFGNIKFFKKDKNDFIFRNFPKRNKENNFNTFEKKIENKFTQWPDKNNFSSIIDFEFDGDNNIYLLDEGNNEGSPIFLYKYDLNGEKKEEYNFLNGSYLLNNFVLDKINNYVYIPYYNYSSEKYGILIRKLKDKENYSYKIIDDSLFIYDKKYNFANKLFNNYSKIINAALSCDGKYLLFCRLSSKMIYSIKTKKLRDIKDLIKINDVNVAYKDDASSSLIYSNMGNLYLTGIERNAIYLANQIENNLAVFDFKIPEKCVIENIANETEYDNIGATKLFISDGHLYINYKKLMCLDKDNICNIATQIYSIKIGHDESYIYKCAGLKYNWKIIAYIFWGVFIVIVILVLLFVFIGNDQDKRTNIKKNK